MSFTCEICSTTFTRIDNLSKHVKNLHPNEYHPNGFDCDRCEKSFRVEGSLTSHVRRKHPKVGKVKKQSSSTIQHRKDGKVMKKSKFVSPFWSQRLVCEYCLKKARFKKWCNEILIHIYVGKVPSCTFVKFWLVPHAY